MLITITNNFGVCLLIQFRLLIYKIQKILIVQNLLNDVADTKPNFDPDELVLTKKEILSFCESHRKMGKESC